MNGDSLSARLKSLRLKCGLSLADLAKRVNTSAATLSKYENGWERFEVYTLNKIAWALGYRLVIDFELAEVGRFPKGIASIIKKIGRLFWDQPLTKGDFREYPLWITERVIAYGNLEDIYMLEEYFGRKAFLRYISKCRFQTAKTEAFWRRILEREKIPCTKRPFPREVKIC